MLGALEDSARAQRQLVSDASHELRTPLTSLRTNIEVLARDEALPPGDREQLLRDVTEQLTEMTALIAELVELARGDQHAERSRGRPPRPRHRRTRSSGRAATAPGVTFNASLEPVADPGRAGDASSGPSSNLLDNAAKWSPAGGEVEVAVRDGELTVRDHGPGIDEADLPFVFDRFYRAPAARGMPRLGARTRDRAPGGRGARRHGRRRPSRRRRDTHEAEPEREVLIRS